MGILKAYRIGFIGTGNMAQAIMTALVENKTVDPKKIHIYNRSSKKQEKLVSELGVTGEKGADGVAEKADILFICVKPQDFGDALSPIVPMLDDRHVVVSIAAGITVRSISKLLPNTKRIVRVMPNTAVQIQKGVVGFCMSDAAKELEQTIMELLAPLGLVIPAEEGDPFEAIMVSSASGTGFIFELMMYWQDWLEERGFSEKMSRDITIQTFLGAALMAQKQQNHTLQGLQDAVVSKKGTTWAGLESMREEDIERLLRIGFEKAAMRSQELGRSLGG